MTLDELIEHVVENIPEGFEIRISIGCDGCEAFFETEEEIADDELWIKKDLSYEKKILALLDYFKQVELRRKNKLSS